MDSPPAPEISDDAQYPVDDEGDIQQLPIDLPSQDDQPKRSLHALARVTTPQTMCVIGFFKKPLLQYSLIMVVLITSLNLGLPNMLIVFSILAQALKSCLVMGNLTLQREE